MHKNFLTQLAVTAIVPVAALSFSYTAQAINIGEVVSQSKIGEPLRTQIELTGSGYELVEDACLSLVTPDPNEEGAHDFLTAAKLAVKTEGKRQFVVISSHRPYNDPFIRIKLRVRCVGVGNVVKSFTILPDFAEVLPIAAPVVAAEAGSMAASSSSGASKNGMSTSLSADQNILPERRQTRPRRGKQRSHAAVRDASGETRQPSPRIRSSSAQHARSNQSKSESFRLRLSGASIDESRIGKISQEERSLLLARQKLLDADDQMASFLALQNQVKQLQAELGMVKLKLGQLGVSVSSPAVAPSVAVAQVAPAKVAPAQEIQPQLAQQTSPAPPLPEATAPQPSEAKPDNVQNQQAQNQQGQNLHPVKQRKPKIQRGPIIIGLLALLGLLLGLRYLMRIRTQSAGAKPVLKRAAVAPASAPADAIPSAPAAKPAMQTRIAQPGPKPAGKPAAPKPAAAFKARTGIPPVKTPAIAPPAAQKMAEPSSVASSSAHERTQEELAETDSIIEEAELYAIHGHPDRAVLILKELIQQHATKTEAWMLLFSIYSSLKKMAEFEKAARDFMRVNKDSNSWPEIQALGRSIDPGNLMYFDISTAGTAGTGAAPAPQALLGKRALLGDILLAMGALSIKEMEKCLAEFDPKVDGRFGGFLIKRNMITEAQLDAALLQQQLNNEANTIQAEDAPKVEETPGAEETPEPKNAMLPALEFEPPAMDLPKMTKSPESGHPAGFKEGDT